MKIFYYYHIPKTGGSSIGRFLRFLSFNVPNSKLYNFNRGHKLLRRLVEVSNDIPKNIDFNRLLSLDNISQYDYIFIHHHHGYCGLMEYEDILIKKKKKN